MRNTYDIGEVARATGLTARALRFYESSGLVTPLRTRGGRRVYGEGELSRLNAAVALKRAGFSLRRIGELLNDRMVDLSRLVAAQLAQIEAEASALAASRTLLLSVQARLDRGDTIDIRTICSLIRATETIMNHLGWKPIVDDYFTPQTQEHFRTKTPDGFDREEYGAKWKELGERIAAALPLDPTSADAQQLVDAWFALLRPFTEVATPEMWNGVVRMYDDRPNWKAQPEMGFQEDVWTFIRLATMARIDAGGKVDGPSWMAGA